MSIQPPTNAKSEQATRLELDIETQTGPSKIDSIPACHLSRLHPNVHPVTHRRTPARPPPLDTPDLDLERDLAVCSQRQTRSAGAG